MFPFNSYVDVDGKYIVDICAGPGTVSRDRVEGVAAKPSTTAWISDQSGVTIFSGGKSSTVPKTHVNYDKIVDALRNKDYDLIDNLVNVAKSLEKFSNGTVTVLNGQVFFNGEALHNVMTDRMLEMLREGFDIQPLACFMENLFSNPSSTAVNELYLFLESGKLPITEDGYFLAYKKVKNNFFDIYTGKFDHSPGKTLEMPRNKVDDRRDNTCSYGFHFCSISYLPQYSSNDDNRVIIVKINPADVVSIPSDYANAKGRTCRYEVVGEYTGNWKNGKAAFNESPVVNEWGNWDDYEPAARDTPVKDLPLRDPVTGRFVKTGSTRWYELREEGF